MPTATSVMVGQARGIRYLVKCISSSISISAAFGKQHVRLIEYRSALADQNPRAHASYLSVLRRHDQHVQSSSSRFPPFVVDRLSAFCQQEMMGDY